MKAKFKGPKKIDGKLYAKGEHALADAHADHWYTKALIKSGDIVVLDKPEPASESKAEKSEEKEEDAAPASQPQGKKKAK